jgi:hypothetical protein
MLPLNLGENPALLTTVLIWGNPSTRCCGSYNSPYLGEPLNRLLRFLQQSLFGGTPQQAVALLGMFLVH